MVKLGLSHEQLGELTGCSREAISTAIGALRSAGVTEVSRVGIAVTDVEALIDLAAFSTEVDDMPRSLLSRAPAAANRGCTG